jgi:hypothetical protein
VVFKLDSAALQELLGDNGVDPRWALAWKFAGAVGATQLLVGRRQGPATCVPHVVAGAAAALLPGQPTRLPGPRRRTSS